MSAKILQEVDPLANVSDDARYGFKYIPLTELQSDPDQPRTEISRQKGPGDGSSERFDSMEELTESVRMHGILEPIIARKNPNGAGYIIVAGARRHAAARAAGLADAPVVIAKGMQVENDGRRAVTQIVENLHRDDMSGLELGNAVIRLRNEFAMSQKDIARLLRRSESTISRWATAASADSRDHLAACNGQASTLELFRGLDEQTQESALARYTESGQTLSQQDVRKLAVYSGLKGPIADGTALSAALSASLDELKQKEAERKSLSQAQERQEKREGNRQETAAERVTATLKRISEIDPDVMFAGIETADVAPEGSVQFGIGLTDDFSRLQEPDFAAASSSSRVKNERPPGVQLPELYISMLRAKELLILLGKSDAGNEFDIGVRLAGAIRGN